MLINWLGKQKYYSVLEQKNDVHSICQIVIVKRVCTANEIAQLTCACHSQQTGKREKRTGALSGEIIVMQTTCSTRVVHNNTWKWWNKSERHYLSVGNYTTQNWKNKKVKTTIELTNTFTRLQKHKSNYFVILKFWMLVKNAQTNEILFN